MPSPPSPTVRASLVRRAYSAGYRKALADVGAEVTTLVRSEMRTLYAAVDQHLTALQAECRGLEREAARDRIRYAEIERALARSCPDEGDIWLH